MAAAAQKTVYEQVVEVTYEYLGPAAERFIEREVKAHLKKEPEDLTKADVVKLVDWSKLAIALLTDNAQLVDDYTKNLLAIANSKRL